MNNGRPCFGISCVVMLLLAFKLTSEILIFRRFCCWWVVSCCKQRVIKALNLGDASRCHSMVWPWDCGEVGDLVLGCPWFRWSRDCLCCSCRTFHWLCVCQWRSWPSQPGGWKDGATLPFRELRSVSFKKRARWFAKVLKEVLRHAGCSVPSGYVRPCSQMIAMHTGYLAVPWPVARLVQIGGWCILPTKPYRRQSKDMDRLLLPVRMTISPGEP